MGIAQKLDWNDSFPESEFSREVPQNSNRKLTTPEIQILEKCQNSSADWEQIRVTEDFNPNLIHHSEFFGRVYIGKLTAGFLEFNGFQVPVGIRHSTIINSVIGDNVSGLGVDDRFGSAGRTLRTRSWPGSVHRPRRRGCS